MSLEICARATWASLVFPRGRRTRTREWNKFISFNLFRISLSIREGSTVPPNSTMIPTVFSWGPWKLLLPMGPYVTTFSRHWDSLSSDAATVPTSLLNWSCGGQSTCSIPTSQCRGLFFSVPDSQCPRLREEVGDDIRIDGKECFRAHTGMPLDSDTQ